MRLEPISCECDQQGIDHSAHGCDRIAVYRVIRGIVPNVRILRVCGDCILSGDDDVTPLDTDGMRKPLVRLVF